MQPPSTAKFKVGDYARFSSRAPDAIKKLFPELLKRSRRIVKAVYVPEAKATFYYLGTNNRSYNSRRLASVGFRSFELVKVDKVKLHTRGRPRLKRKYKHKTHTK